MHRCPCLKHAHISFNQFVLLLAAIPWATSSCALTMCRTCMFPVVDMTVVDQIPRRERFRAHTSSLYLIYACLPLLRLGNRIHLCSSQRIAHWMNVVAHSAQFFRESSMYFFFGCAIKHIYNS